MKQIVAGNIVATTQGWQKVSSVRNVSGSVFFQTGAGWLGEKEILSPKLEKIATKLFVILSYDKSINRVIREAIEQAGYPVDDKVNWANWFNSTFNGKVSTQDEDLIDDAIQEILFLGFYKRKLLDQFDPKRLPTDVQQKPLDKQITYWIKYWFYRHIPQFKEYISDAFGFVRDSEDAEGNKIQGIETKSIFQTNEENEEINILDELLPVESEVKKIEEDEELLVLREEFKNWLDKEQQEKTVKTLMIIFDLIVASDKGKKSEFEKEFKKLTKLGKDSLKYLYSKFGKLMKEFAQENPELDFTLLRLIRNFKKKVNEDERVKSHLSSKTSFLNVPEAEGESGQNPEAPNNDSGTYKDDPYWNSSDAITVIDRKATIQSTPAVTNTTAPNNKPNAAPPPPAPAPQEQQQSTQNQQQTQNQNTENNNEENNTGIPKRTIPPELPGVHISMERKMKTIRKKLTASEREKIRFQLRAKLNKFARLQKVAEENKTEVDEALTELGGLFSSLANALSNLKENLGLIKASKTASIKHRIAAHKNYGKPFELIASEEPEAVAEALSEVYTAINETAEGIENLADHLGVTLNLAEAEAEADEMALDEAVDEDEITDEEVAEGEEEAEIDEDEEEIEENEEEIEELEDEEDEIEKEASGSQGFWTNREKEGKEPGKAASRRRLLTKKLPRL